GGDVADETFAEAEPRAVHGLALQALGREELEHLPRPQHVDRADFGDELGRDQAHDLVEAGLRQPSPSHDVAQSFEESARTDQAGRLAHWLAASSRSLVSNAVSA